jgi:hypothetical protein
MGTQNLPARREESELASIVLEPGMLPASKLIARSELVQEVLRSVMRPGVDYAKVPGTDREMLLKPGAEKIALTFAISVEMETLESVVTETEVSFRVRAVAREFSGRILATSEASCSTREKKYRWRRPVCKEEFEEAPASSKQVTWIKGKGNRPAERMFSVRMEIGEVIHTCLSMAQKRAHTAVIMRSTGASDIFAEEDLGGSEEHPGPGRSQAPTVEDLLAGYDGCADEVGLARLERDRQEAWPKASATDKELLKKAAELARDRIQKATTKAP